MQETKAQGKFFNVILTRSSGALLDFPKPCISARATDKNVGDVCFSMTLRNI